MKKTASITLSRPGEPKLYLGGAFKLPTSFPGNAIISFAVPALDREDPVFRKVVGFLLDDGTILDVNTGFINIRGRL